MRLVRIGDHKQLWSGCFFVLLGIGTLLCLPANVGSAAAMGPGYLPMLLASCLILLGCGSVVAGILSHASIRAEPLSVPTIVSVVAGVWAFAYLIDVAGLAVSLLCMLLLSCSNRVLRHPFEVACTYVVLLGMTWFIFIHLIQLSIKVFWWS